MKFTKLFLLASSLFLLTSCDYKELSYDNSQSASVHVRFDWQKAPDMDAKGMTVLFYDTQKAGDPERYDFVGRDGGTARLVTGSYRAVAYNYDTETILYRGMENSSTLEAYTRRSSIEEGTQMAAISRGYTMPRAGGTEDEPVILEPDPLCGAQSDDFLLDANVPGDITVMPHKRTREVVITINHVPNLQYTSQIGGALTGLAPSVNMTTGELGEETATQAFAAVVAGDSTIVMTFRIFGHCPHATGTQHNAHLLTVYAVLADGSKWYYTQDVGNQMHDPSHGGGGGGSDENVEIDIVVDDLPIPKPIVNGSGFQPTIDGWQGIEIPVDM